RASHITQISKRLFFKEQKNGWSGSSACTNHYIHHTGQSACTNHYIHRTGQSACSNHYIHRTAARRKINEEFRKNKNETSEENISQMIKMAAGVEVFLRQDVVQAEHVAEDRIQLRPRESLLLENVPYCDTPRKRSSSNNAPKQSCNDAPITRCE
uniref:Complex III assembly factor LYRM7 n=1 Tax=Oncorhynchus tshawytscha TaxID=74940 RepID=A0AAZ3P482_ONCTS